MSGPRRAHARPAGPVGAFALAVLVALLGSGCTDLGDLVAGSPAPDVEHPVPVVLDGALRLKIPGNWRFELEHEVEDGVEVSSVDIDNPLGCLVNVQVFRPAAELTAAEVVDLQLEAMPEALRESVLGGMLGQIAVTRGERVPVRRTLFGASREGLLQHYRIQLGDTKTQDEMEVYTVDEADRSAVITVHTDEDNRAKARPAVDLILGSLAWLVPAPASAAAAPPAAVDGAPAPGAAPPGRPPTPEPPPADRR